MNKSKKVSKKDAPSKKPSKKPLKNTLKKVTNKEVEEKRPVGRPRKEGGTKTTFKENYDNDPEFKKKHLKYVTAKVKCECGFMTCRNNMLKHKKSHIHINKMQLIKEEESKILGLEMIKLNKNIEIQNKLLEKLIKKSIK